jgi:hypothetical protein
MAPIAERLVPETAGAILTEAAYVHGRQWVGVG